MLYTITTELPIISQRDDPDVLDVLVSALQGYHPAAGAGAGQRVGVTISLPAESLEQAIRTALAVIRTATGMEAVTVEAMTSDDFDRRGGLEPVPELVSLVEAAELLGVSRQAVQQQVDRGAFITAQKVGSTWVLARTELDAAIRHRNKMTELRGRVARSMERESDAMTQKETEGQETR